MPASLAIAGVNGSSGGSRLVRSVSGSSAFIRSAWTRGPWTSNDNPQAHQGMSVSSSKGFGTAASPCRAARSGGASSGTSSSIDSDAIGSTSST